MQQLLFGTAGIPISAVPRDTVSGIRQVRRLGLGCMELEFVHSVNLREPAWPSVRTASSDNAVVLSCHGQYYVNLNAAEEKKLAGSRSRMVSAARAAAGCGAFSIAFHMAYYLGMQPEAVYRRVKENLEAVLQALAGDGVKISVRPEVTGKRTQFGSLSEVLRLSSELEGVLPCLDFAHLHAREGKVNSYGEFCGVLEELEKALGKSALHDMHIQVSGVEYSDKGELRHLPLAHSDLNYRDLVRAWREFGIRGVVISESPNIEQDALLLKNEYEKA